LVDRYSGIAVESLNIKGMLKNRRLSRSIADAGWGQFLEILSCKAESAGAKLMKVDAKNTSQECSGCGNVVRKALSVRVHRCDCGLVLDRDVNAAKNIPLCANMRETASVLFP
jgi:putative transposase